ncbi:MAG: beta-lactamase family protein [Acidimicrobiia bacterium]|nr:beta-lactamase family protein [Acidimicrobiia bacterium]
MNQPTALARQVADEIGFSGALRMSQRDIVVQEFATGFAGRARRIPNRVDTRFATASATKGMTALAVMSLIESGEFTLETTVREILDDMLPMVDERVTVAHLLSHQSGVGDYLDEESLGDIDDHTLDVSVHSLERPIDYLPLVDGIPQVFVPGERFAYNNSGFIILAIIIEKVTGSYHEAVIQRVLEPAGITAGGFFRSDDLPDNTALGYLGNGRTNVFHLPVIGIGDGGIYLTLNDVSAFWKTMFAGEIVSTRSVEQMTTPTHMGDDGQGYGLGFWLKDGGDHVALVGMDPGVSFRSTFRQSTGAMYVVMSNTSSGVWPISRALDESE